MKKLFILALVIVMAIGISPMLYAGNTKTQTVNTSCDVPNAFDMTMVIKDSTGASDTVMNFGQLVHAEPANQGSPFIGSKAYNVWLTVASTAGRQYHIKQEANRLLTSGANTITQNAFCATTIAAGSTLNGGTLDQAGVPRGVAVAARNIFDSTATGGNATVQLSYGVTNHSPDDGSGYSATTDVVPASQTAGTYTNTVTYTAYD